MRTLHARDRALIVFLLIVYNNGFTIHHKRCTSRNNIRSIRRSDRGSVQLPPEQHEQLSLVRFASPPRDSDPEAAKKKKSVALSSSLFRIIFKATAKKIPVVARGVLLVAAVAMTNRFLFKTSPVQAASAPIMALPKMEVQDPVAEVHQEYDRRMQKQVQAELKQMAERGREIEETQGAKARLRFEKEYKINMQKRADEKAAGLIELQRNLLDQGIDPWCDIEGQRQVTFYEKGIDLGDVAGTPYHVDKYMEQKSYKKSTAYQKAYHRQVISCMVQDMKNRDVDPLEYFRSNPHKTQAILKMSPTQAKALAENYSGNIQRYGQIAPPKEGEMSALERIQQQNDSPEAKKAAKEAAKKALKQAAKEAAMKLKKDAKEQAQALKRKALELEEAKKAELIRQAELLKEKGAPLLPDLSLDDDVDDRLEETEDEALAPPISSPLQTAMKSSTQNNVPIVPVSVFLVTAGGGGFALKLYKDKAARDEEERQRQFRLLMGIGKNENASKSTKSSSSALVVDEENDVDDILNAEPSQSVPVNNVVPTSTSTPALEPEPAPVPRQEPESKPVPAETQASATTAPKKKKLNLGVFSRKKNGRETDLNALVQYGAKAPEFAKLLAKILTYGARGRFPNVVTLPGKMPFEVFDLETAKSLLVDARRSAVLELEESAEVFANVVNCMLIDIVDLASSSIKEDDKTTIEAIDIVVDFMQHAASLYDAVAGDVQIAPVTYGGSLAKSKLETMYSVYAGSVMTTSGTTRDDFDERVRLLQDVFQITDKKAEGLMLKVMQKNMMEMMKSGEGLEGMQQMLGGLDGMDGMMPNGMPGLDGEEPSPEQVKEMLLGLKQMKDSGSFSKEDLETIKKEFKSSFGSSVDDLSNGQPLDATEQELLVLMKSILDD